MNVQTISHTDRQALPRALVGRRRPTFLFEIGDIVDHVMGGMLAVVLNRSLTAAGIDVYAIKEFANPGEVRVMRGPYMVRAEPN
jgi:hypothetical protein